MSIVNLYEAKTNLSALVQRASEGEVIVIARNGKPAARLVPLVPVIPERRPGAWAGRLWLSPDFYNSDAELERLMLGEHAGE